MLPLQSHNKPTNFVRAKRFHSILGMCVLVALLFAHCSTESSNSEGADDGQEENGGASVAGSNHQNPDQGVSPWQNRRNPYADRTPPLEPQKFLEEHKDAAGLDVIPNDALAVVLIDAHAIMTKSGLATLEDHPGMQILKEEMDISEVPYFVDEALDGGIDTTGQAAIWITGLGEDVTFGCSVVLKDANKFEAYLKNQGEENGVNWAFSQDEDLRFLEVRGEEDACLVWDDQVAIFVVLDNVLRQGSAKELARNWMSMDEEGLLLSDGAFQRLIIEKKDIRLWMNGDAMARSIDPRALEIPREIWGAVRESWTGKFVSSFNFDQGSMTLDSWRTEVSEEAKDLFDNQFNQELLDFVPSELPGMIALAINVDEIEKRAESMMNPREWQDIRFQLELFGIEAFSDVLGGSALMVLHGMEAVENPYDKKYFTPQPEPVASLLLDLESDDVLDNLVKLGEMQGVLRDEGTYYSVQMPTPEGPSIYLDWNSSALLVTSDRTTVRRFESGGYGSESLGADSHGSTEIAGSNVFGQIDLKKLISESAKRGVSEEYFLYNMDMALSERVNLQDLINGATIFASADNATVRMSMGNAQMNSLAFVLETMLDEIEYENRAEAAMP